MRDIISHKYSKILAALAIFAVILILLGLFKNGVAADIYKIEKADPPYLYKYDAATYNLAAGKNQDLPWFTLTQSKRQIDFTVMDSSQNSEVKVIDENTKPTIWYQDANQKTDFWIAPDQEKTELSFSIDSTTTKLPVLKTTVDKFIPEADAVGERISFNTLTNRKSFVLKDAQIKDAKGNIGKISLNLEKHELTDGSGTNYYYNISFNNKDNQWLSSVDRAFPVKLSVNLVSLFHDRLIDITPVKSGYSAFEKPQFILDPKSVDDPLKSALVRRNFTNVRFGIIDASGQGYSLPVTTSDAKDGKLLVEFNNSSGQIKPGLYDLLVQFENNPSFIGESEFSWGVLTINPDQSVYKSGQNARLDIAVLDDIGKVVCDAQVNLQIIDPEGAKTTLSTTDKSIKITDGCNEKETLLPDYTTNFKTSSEGKYKLNLTAITGKGSYTIEDSFLVDNDSPFYVRRSGPTRIYPPKSYEMNIEIEVNKDANNISELVPKDFTISKNNSALSQNEAGQLLSWNKKVKKGDILNLSYEFLAPNISPALYFVGPLKIGSWQEPRVWQIAADATSGKMTLYLHKEDPDIDTTYETATLTPPEPTVFREPTGNGSTTTFSTPPCEASNLTDASFNQPRIDMDAGTGEFCAATFFSLPVGQSISIETTDTNAIYATTWGIRNSAANNGVARPVFRLYKLTPPSTYTIFFNSPGTTNFGTSSTQSSVTGTPSANVTLAAGDRIAVVVNFEVTTQDSSSGQDYGGLQFDHTSAPARVELNYTIITPSKPDLTGGDDDDFNPGSPDSANCSASAPSGWTCHTTVGSWNRASDSTHWVWLRNVQGGSLGTEFSTTPSNTFIYKSMPSGNGAITTVLNSSTTSEINQVNASSPYFHGGLVLWTSNTDYLQLQVHNAAGTHQVQVNNSGSLDGTRVTTLSSGASTWNRVWLRWSISGSNFTAQYSTDGTSFTDLGTAISHGTAFTRVGLNSYAALADSDYGAAFEWYDSDVTVPTGPTMDQVMRHGKWFDGSSEQPMTF